MGKIIEGKTRLRNKKVGIVVARFNEFITERLLNGCLDELKKSGIKTSDITIVRVPGSYEIPRGGPTFG